MGFEDYADEPVMTNGFFQARGGLNYSTLFFYEKKFFNERYVESKKEWMRTNWNLSIFYAFVYIVAVFAGQHFMKSRQKFDLRRALIAWNFVLAAFSIMGTIRVWPEFYHTLSTKGKYFYFYYYNYLFFFLFFFSSLIIKGLNTQYAITIIPMA
jgi:hypothetical protein